MKCLKTSDWYGTIMPNRYRNEDAAQMVASGKYAYCTKEDWKEEVRDAGKKKVSDGNPPANKTSEVCKNRKTKRLKRRKT